MIRFLLISIVLSLSSCALKTTEGLRQVAFTKNTVENPYFSNSDIDYVYKAKIEAYGKNYSGVLIIKKTGNNQHRVVVTTEFGNKLLDFEYSGDEFTKKSIIPDLDRKFIVEILKQDFAFLITESAKVEKVYKKDDLVVYKTLYDDGFNFYFVEEDSGILRQLIHTSNTKEKVIIDFDSDRKDFAKQIRIEHKNIKLNIDLQRIENE